MSDYSGISNISPEDRKRLLETSTSTGEGTLLVESAGILVSPVSPTINFEGSGVSLASVDGKTIVTVPGGGGVGVAISASEWSPDVIQSVADTGEVFLNMFTNEDFNDDDDFTFTNDSTLTCQRSGVSNRYKFTVQWTLRRTSGTDEDGILDLQVGGAIVRGVVWSNEGSGASIDVETYTMTCTAIVALGQTVRTAKQEGLGPMGFNFFPDPTSFMLIERMN